MEQSRLDLQFRAATAEDLEALVAIRIAAMRQSLEKVGRFDPVRARERLTKDFRTENTRCFIFHHTLVGFIISNKDNDEITIHHLYVLPEFQNRGIGRMALDEIIKQGKREKLDIRLITLKESRANNFYLKNGFKYLSSIEFDNVYLKKWNNKKPANR
jgi:ribosomal protein S18 acetylase RimI-like enzyme